MKNKENQIIAAPAFLVQAESYQQGCRKISRFLNNTVLIKYGHVAFSRERSIPANDHSFWPTAERLIEKNRQSVLELIEELQKNGFHQLSELAGMKQGYESKVLHTLVHLLDGFIGIDSSFYNLVEDSHSISSTLRSKIKQSSNQYWLLQVEAENPRTFI